MKIRILFLTILFPALFLTACFKEDDMIEPHPRGNVKTDTIALTDNYRYQVYFDLDSAGVVRSNVKTTYDLGFECTPPSAKIILNTSNFMKVADLGEVQFGIGYDTVGLKWKFDKSDGNPDSNAIGQWYKVAGSDTVSAKHVYAIDRGLDENGNPLGLYQVIFDSLSSGRYFFRYAPLKGGSAVSAEVQRDKTVSYIYFSLASGSVENPEPAKNDFDLLFTQYTTLLFTNEGIPYPYLVTGVMLNRHLVVASRDTVHEFSSIDREIAMKASYTGALDAIGYDWKHYDFNSGAYTVNPAFSYLIRSAGGYFYKLRFIGFYNSVGQKGYPVIEYQRL